MRSTAWCTREVSATCAQPGSESATSEQLHVAMTAAGWSTRATYGIALELGVGPAVRKEHRQGLAGIAIATGGDGRYQIGVAGDQHDGVAGVVADQPRQCRADGDVGLLLLERHEATSALRAGALAALELPETGLDARGAQRLKVAHLPAHDARPPGLEMMGKRREVDDALQNALARQRVQIRGAERGDVEPAHGATQDTLAVEHRVVQVEAVDKEDRAVDDGPPEEKSPRGRNPGGPTEHAPWGWMARVSRGSLGGSSSCGKRHPGPRIAGDRLKARS